MNTKFTRHLIAATGLALFVFAAAGTSNVSTPPRMTNAAVSTPSALPLRPLQRNVRVQAATLFTDRYSQPPFTEWHIHASAAGRDHSMLLVQVGVILDESMVEAMHYGTGAYDKYGGVQRFSIEQTFRGVLYRDVSGKCWRYGKVTADDERAFACR
jgi:hypothetical protein